MQICPFSIRCSDSNPPLLEHESSSITARPGLPPQKLYLVLPFANDSPFSCRGKEKKVAEKRCSRSLACSHGSCTNPGCYKHNNSTDKNSNAKKKERGAAIAQWIHLRLPSCCPGFESQAHNLHFYEFIFELRIWKR